MKFQIFLLILAVSCCTANPMTLFKSSSSEKNITQILENDTDNQINIVGGENATQNEFPHLVNLQIGDYICGGSLIDLDLVLTAAHCVYEQSHLTIRVTAGDYEYDPDIKEPNEQITYVQAIRWHEEYNNITLENDIALVWLNINLTRTDAVYPIELPPANMQVNFSSSAVLAGWGKIKKESENPEAILKKVTVPLWQMIDCKKAYPNPSSSIQITDNQFCAGTKGKGACGGDSGGPVLCDKVFCGIVSHGHKSDCAAENYPDVFTKVSSYIDWINKFRKGTPPATPSPSNARSFTLNLQSPASLFLIITFLMLN